MYTLIAASKGFNAHLHDNYSGGPRGVGKGCTNENGLDELLTWKWPADICQYTRQAAAKAKDLGIEEAHNQSRAVGQPMKG